MEVTWAKHNESEPWGIRPYHRLDCAYANRPERVEGNWGKDQVEIAVAEEREPCAVCRPASKRLVSCCQARPG